MKIKIGIYVALLVVLFSAFVLASGERIPVKYLKTSDGDTMRAVIDGENVRIRFLGINTPEVSGENKVEEPWGNEALAFSKEQLDKAQKIEIEYDDVADHEDRFGRKLAWIWVDDELFELKLLEKGLAKTYMLQNDYKYASELKTAERKAKTEKIGVWSDKDPQEAPINTPTTEKEETIPQLVPVEQEEYPTEELSVGSFVVAVIIILVIIIYTKQKNRKGSNHKK